jgi:hypothetical protein
METFNLTRYQLLEVLSAAAELGASRVMEKKEWISKAAAYKRFGRKSVDRWINEQQIEQVYQHRRIKLNTDRLLELQRTDELCTKFITKR